MIKENDLLENENVREELLNKRNYDVIQKVKDIVFLGNDKVVTINQVADYYKVTQQVIKRNYLRHKDEFEQDGVVVYRKEQLSNLKSLIKGKVQEVPNLEWLNEKLKYTRQITIFPRRAILRVGMLLRDSEIAKTVRSYLLNVEESVDTNTKEWAIEREVSKKLRKQLTETLERSGEVTRMKGWAYSTYTNMMYDLLFGKKANELYEERNVPKGKLRDYFNEDELEAIRQLESSVCGLLNLGYEYSEVKNLVNERFDKNLIKF